MKKIISIILAVVVGISIMIYSPAYANTLTTSEDYIPSETLIQGNITVVSEERVLTDNKAEVKKLMKSCKEKMNAAKKMKNAGYDLDYDDSHVIIKTAKKEWSNAKADYEHYKQLYDELCWQEKVDKYPVAAEIWSYLKAQGYNDYVCAGILGNIMTEVGGQTLNIKYWTSGDGYYGMCQWSIKYFPGVLGADLKGQCKFLSRNIEKAFNSWGYLYSSGFDYNSFCKLKNEKDVAYAFARCYERCSSASYSQRQANATKAYEYFKGA